MSKQTIIDESIIPSGDPVWLNKTRLLPTPEEVKAWPDELKNHLGERIVRFAHLNLVVKHGTNTRTTEGKALWMISQYCGNTVPIPDVYGWCTYGEDTFLYMQLVEGVTLQECWATLREEDKVSIADQLSVAFSSIRSLRQEPDNIYVGMFIQNIHNSNCLLNSINPQVRYITDQPRTKFGVIYPTPPLAPLPPPSLSPMPYSQLAFAIRASQKTYTGNIKLLEMHFRTMCKLPLHTPTWHLPISWFQ